MIFIEVYNSGRLEEILKMLGDVLLGALRTILDIIIDFIHSRRLCSRCDADITEQLQRATGLSDATPICWKNTFRAW
jgi:hypothetical protein